MSRRPVNPIGRRFAESAVTPSSSPSHQKARSSPILSLGLVILGAFLLLGYSYSGSGLTNKGYSREALSNEEDISCGSEIIKALPILREVYGESAHKMLHVGPESCAVTSKLLKEEDIEAWGIDPFDIIPPLDKSCKSLIRKGIVRVADIKFALPYKAQSFSIVLVSDAPDSLSPKYLNKTLPDLARVSIDGLVMFVATGLPLKWKAIFRDRMPYYFRINHLFLHEVSQANQVIDLQQKQPKLFNRALGGLQSCEVKHGGKGPLRLWVCTKTKVCLKSLRNLR